MKQSILDKLAAAITNPDEAIDPTLVMAFLSAVITAWKSCRNPEVAKAQTLAGGPVAYGQAIRIVRQETDLRGKPARMKAMALVEAGTKLTPEEIAELENEAKDVPAATGGFGVTSIPVGIFQFSLIMSCLLFFTAPVQAQSGIFQIDIEQNRRLDVLEKKIDDIANQIGLNTPIVVAPALKSTLPATALSMAMRVQPAYEIRNGIQTHTSDAHLLQHGYTASQIAGLTPDQKDHLHGAAHAGNFSPQQVQAATKGNLTQRTVTVSAEYVDLCQGRNCRRIRRR